LEASSGQPHQRRRPPLFRAARQRRRPPLHRRLASGGGHLCTGGLPATAATSTRVKRSLPSSSYGGEDKTPWGGVGAVRPMAQGTPRMRRTCARCDRRPCGGRTAKPRLAAGGSIGGSTKAIKSKNMESQHDSLPTPKSWGARGMEPWLSPLSTFMRLVIILPPECWRKKREGTSPLRTSRGGRR
jgi:hypothetical protein